MVLLIINALPGYFIYRFMQCLIYFKENKLLQAGAAIGFGILCQTVIYGGDSFNVCASLAVTWMIVFAAARGMASAKLAVTMIVFSLMTAMSYIQCNNSFIEQMLMDNMLTGNLGGTNVEIYFFITNMSKAVLWASIYYFFRKKLVRIKTYMRKENWQNVIIIETCSFLSILCIIFGQPAAYSRADDVLRELPFIGWIVVFASAITNIGLISLLPQMIESVHFKQEEQKAGIREEYYCSLEEQQEKIRKLRHDINNHFQMLQTYLTVGEADKAKEYLEHMDIKALQYGGRDFCREAALNAMLNNRYDKLCETGADVHFNIAIPELTGIGVVDLCTIVSNSLDNAIEAVRKQEKAEDRKVTLKARYEKGYFSYKLVNSKCNEICTKNGSFLSDKAGKNHGYGIENIREIVEKYDGKLDIDYTDTEFTLFLYMNEV